MNLNLKRHKWYIVGGLVSIFFGIINPGTKIIAFFVLFPFQHTLLPLFHLNFFEDFFVIIFLSLVLTFLDGVFWVWVAKFILKIIKGVKNGKYE